MAAWTRNQRSGRLSTCCEISEDEIETISIDGKVMCGSLRQHLPAVTLLAAVDHKTGCVFQQCRVPSDTNEHQPALAMLKEMVLKGKLVVGDAAFCQRDLCQQIIDGDGDYLLPVKDNQPGRLRDIELEFTAEEAAFPPCQPLVRELERDATRTHNKKHGRIETRHLTSTTALEGYSDWPGLKQVIRLRRRRQNTATGKVENSVAYFVTSLSREQTDARRLLRAIRRHWGAIENGLHWVRDQISPLSGCPGSGGLGLSFSLATTPPIISWLCHRNEYDVIAGRSSSAIAFERLAPCPMILRNSFWSD